MENIEAMLCAYIEGDLDAAGRAQIEKHLQDHPQHRKLIQELSAMRDLVRGLPRVKAPVEIGESLRGKVERSILLGDTGDTEQPIAGGSRWPQVFAIAAIFLLCASLCLVLYKALGPTMKPPVFTDGVASKLSVVPPTDLVTPPDVPTTQQSAAANVPTDTSQLETASPPVAAALSAPVQHLQVAIQQTVAAPARFNLEAIRQRLLNFGYDISGGAAHPTSPALMVVNSTDLPATDAQVAQFLNESSNISWKKVPVNDEPKSIPATIPSVKVAVASADYKLDSDRESGAATTEPSSEVYVAKGLTSQQADALRQSLAVQQNGTEVQIYLQPARALATTQPSAMPPGKDSSIPPEVAGLPATQPSDVATSFGEMTIPTTLPANESTIAPSAATPGGNRTSAADNTTFEANGAAALADNSQAAQPADTVIVIQSTLAVPAGPQPIMPLVSPPPAPIKANTSPATQPSAATQP